MSRFFRRNFAGEKGVAQYIQSTERKKKFQSGIFCLANLSFRIKREIKSFTEKQNPKEVEK